MVNNQQLVSLISEIKEEKSTQIHMFNSRVSNKQSILSNPPEFSDFYEQPHVFEDFEMSAEKRSQAKS